jgi:hypothetical protein
MLRSHHPKSARRLRRYILDAALPALDKLKAVAEKKYFFSCDDERNACLTLARLAQRAQTLPKEDERSKPRRLCHPSLSEAERVECLRELQRLD